ncbi:rhomboid family intramembrane serine protease [Sphingomonas sp. QA11]|uniref:rhomboid family intramembrane serine protease n=1 Tax=Sphingomonas sp. QA11 TaxID=2950605 RepID=UPI002349CF43|nr:rhomboid family intramembrane serine protease [Sphingomonas sp. QA11]WCM27393.1 rhomboid family intramembrane serine protease [Sphingomonas sp. QA11]
MSYRTSRPESLETPSARILGVSLLLAAATVATSMGVAFAAKGSVLATVSVDELHRYGGLAIADMSRFEVWRLASAQLVHAKMGHMLLNVITLFIVGREVERVVGGTWVLIVWLVGGGLATLISPVLVEAPWDIGTGASQATFAFAGCAAVLVLGHAIRPLRGWVLVAFTLIPGLVLDFMSGGYPKPGHVAGMLLGALFGVLSLSLSRRARS